MITESQIALFESFDVMTDDQLNEVFDSAAKYPITNLMPKTKVPHMLLIPVPGNENLAVRFSRYNAKGELIRQVKPGDKMMQVHVMELSPKGHFNTLKNGLGSDPIGALNAITDVTAETMKKFHIDGALLRFNAKKMKGQEKTIARVAGRLIQKRAGGQYKILPELLAFTNKYLYIMIYRKSANIANMEALEIDPELFTITKTSVGEIVTDLKTGEQVTKPEAIAASVAKVEDKKNEKAATRGIHIAKLDLMKALVQKDDKFYAMPGGKIVADDFTPADKIAAIEPKKSEQIDTVTDLFKKNIDSDSLVTWLDSTTLTKEIKQVFTSADLKSVEPGSPQALAKIVESASNVFAHEVETEGFQHRLLRIIDFYGQFMEDQYRRFVTDGIQGTATTGKQAIAIKAYTGAWYSDMNDVFLKNEKPSMKTAEHIKNMDEAFETAGAKVPSGMTLYRGMTAPAQLEKAALENKMFYFANFVSTSAKPIMFASGIGSNGALDARMIDSPEFEIELGTKPESNTAQPSPWRSFFGFAIKETHVPAIFVGPLTSLQKECEVILPRGTIFNFTKVNYHKNEARTNYFIECVAVGKATEGINESIYDGDKLMQTGELVEMDMSQVNDVPTTGNGISFGNFAKPVVSVGPKINGFKILAEIMNPDAMPEKFIQA